MSEQATGNQDMTKLREIMNGVTFAMLVTVDDDGTLHSRPMALQEAEFDGDLWFFTKASAEKVMDIQRERHVNVSFARPNDQTYVSVSGLAQLVRDRQKAESLWSPTYKAWFPDGLDDPDLALIKVRVTKAEYWSSPPSAPTQLIGMAKAMVTGQEYHPGENKELRPGGAHFPQGR